ncbi:MAG: mechanosensitive ion channel [Solirubrobacterales bacterium]|nr:mechanosensitive ion channel [Solirubrobacterales bacterium]
MNDFLDLLIDNDSAAGVAVTTFFIVAVAVALRVVLVPLARRRHRDDAYRRYWAGKIVSYVLVTLAVIALIVLWAPLGGRLSVILGFATAGIAFAMQEVIGALFGWLNILAGRIYTVGDRIEVGGVRGDVMDITPLRTKILEIGSDAAAGGHRSWVSARQPTGRVVTVSNKKTFTEAVFNYSAHLEWIWEEIGFAVGQDADWEAAERILLDVVREQAPDMRGEGEQALEALGRRFLLSPADVEPNTYVRVEQGDVEVVARFVVTVRAARKAKDAITRAVLERFRAAGITIAYQTYAVTGFEAGTDGKQPSGADGGEVA